LPFLKSVQTVPKEELWGSFDVHHMMWIMHVKIGNIIPESTKIRVAL
jgi:hypothetical protein